MNESEGIGVIAKGHSKGGGVLAGLHRRAGRFSR